MNPGLHLAATEFGIFLNNDATPQGIRYVPESVAMHSNNYTPEQAYRRAFGDARALAATWPGPARDFTFLRTALLGWAQDFRKGVRFCRAHRKLGELGHAARIRWRQRTGRLAGFRQGWRDYQR